MGAGRRGDRRTDRPLLGGGGAVLPSEPRGDRLYAVQLLRQVDSVRGVSVPGVAHAGYGLFRGQPWDDQQAEVTTHRELGSLGTQPLQGNLEVLHAGIQILRFESLPRQQLELSRARAVRRLPGRPVSQVLRPCRRVPDAGTGALPTDRGRQGRVHISGVGARRDGLEGGQELLRRGREGAAADRVRPTPSVPQAGRAACQERGYQHPHVDAGDVTVAGGDRQGGPRPGPGPVGVAAGGLASSRTRVHQIVPGGPGEDHRRAGRPVVREGAGAAEAEPRGRAGVFQDRVLLLGAGA